MVKAKKGLIITLFAAMMIFAFGAASAFASTVNDFDEDLYNSTLTGPIEWDDTYHTATANLEYTNANGDVVKVYNVGFEFDQDYTAEDATKADYDKYGLEGTAGPIFVVTLDDVHQNGSVDYVLATLYVQRTGNPNNYRYSWVTGDQITRYSRTYGTWFAGVTPAVRNSVEAEDVFDFSQTTATLASTRPDAGAYGAWYANKDVEPAVYPNPAEVLRVTILDGNQTRTLSSDFYTVEYPAYNAYAYNTETGKDLTLATTISPNAAAIAKYYGAGTLVSTATATTEFTPVVNVANHEWYTAWTIEGSEDNEFTYDGKAHGVVIAHQPEAVTVKYALGTWNKATKSWDAPAAADYTETFAGLKDAGEYKVFVKFISNKNKSEYITSDVYKVWEFPVFVGFKQDELDTEYGKYDRDSLEKAVKDLIVWTTPVDSAEAVSAAIAKYATISGLFTDAGKNTVYAFIDGKDCVYGKDLDAALANYVLLNGDDKASNVREGMTLVIEKIDNKVNFASKTAIYHVKKAKKLKKAKSFQLKATATQGDVKFVKVGGTSKLKVSSTGKVTVKKGLKKGTYKIQVKAYVDGNANFKSAEQTKTIKVKIKK
jgi:hypothetical protein